MVKKDFRFGIAGGVAGVDLNQLSVATNDTAELASTALAILDKLYDPAVQYLKAGVFANHLSSANLCQVDLFDVLSPQERTKRKGLMKALDTINSRYGEHTIHIGSIDPSSIKWHAKKQYISPAYTTSWSQLPLVHPKK